MALVVQGASIISPVYETRTPFQARMNSSVSAGANATQGPQ